MRKSCLLFLLLLSTFISIDVIGQMPSDGFSMYKGEFCTVIGYGQSSWTEYWEGTRLRDNKNVGKFTSKMWMPMIAYGISDKLNVFAGLPYISNSSDAGTMLGKKGLQDISLEAKYLFLDKKNSKKSAFKGFITAGLSFPVSNYAPDFLPYSIGLGAKTFQLRVIGHYEYNDHFFGTIQTGYIAKSRITVDRQTYYNEGQVYSNKMPVPDVWDGAIRAGYKTNAFRADIHFNWQTGTTGSDIRQNDMPYPFNKMNMQSAGVTALYWLPFTKGLAITASADQTIAGRNVGKSFNWMGTIQYVFQPFNKKKNESKK